MSMGESAMKTAPKQREWGDTVHKFTLAREPSFPHRLKQDGAEMQGREGVRQLETRGREGEVAELLGQLATKLFLNCSMQCSQRGIVVLTHPQPFLSRGW